METGLDGAPAGAAASRVISDVLSLARRTHVDPARVRAEPMLAGALAAARRARPDLTVSQDGARARVTLGEASLDLDASGDGLIESALGPALHALLGLIEANADPRAPRAPRAPGPLLATLLDGALRAVDRWSGASTGRRRSDQAIRRHGRLAGAGICIGRRGADIRVLGVQDESGAAAAGLVAGDVLLDVNGASTAGVSVAEVLARLRGPAGTTVEIRIARLAEQPLVVERRALDQPSVTRARRADGVGVVRIAHFSRRTGVEVARALRAMRAPGPLSGVILDLRGNTGGSMLGAAATADLFIADGLLIQALDAEGRPAPGLRPRVDATPGGDVTTPLAALVDGRTASSSELLAAVLRRHGRARLAGTRTFGKTVVGKPHAFEAHDLTVTITSAYMLAAGERLPEDGLEPDWPIEPGAADAADRVAARLLERAGP